MFSAYAQELNRLLALNTNPKLDLSRIKELLALLQLDLSGMRIVQIIGTNGKGSTTAFMQSMLKAHNISCGLFTSPHLSCARERIRLNGEMVSEEQFVEAARHILQLLSQMKEAPSFFEAILAMALSIFAKAQVEVLILEAGLGGRLDATTAIGAHVLGVSMIDLDHQAILGHSLSAIAEEKIKAARYGQSVVSVEQHAEVREALSKAQTNIGFDLQYAKPCQKPLGLFGEHQAQNAGLAISCLEKLGLEIAASSIEQGLLHVSWPGRFEKISLDPFIVLDGAHNPSGIRVLIKAVLAETSFKGKALFLVFGSLKSVNTQEKISGLLELAPKQIFIHCSKNPRAESAAQLIDYFSAAGFKDGITNLQSWEQLLEDAKLHDANILICGSLYTVGEARSFFTNAPTDHANPNF